MGPTHVSFRLPPALLPNVALALGSLPDSTSVLTAEGTRISWGGQGLLLRPNGSVQFSGTYQGVGVLREALRALFEGVLVSIGTDEVGLSDPAGPVVVAGVVVSPVGASELLCAGVRDSKQLTDEDALRLKVLVLSHAVACSVVVLEPEDLNVTDHKGAAMLLGKAHSDVVARVLQDARVSEPPVVRLGLSRRSLFQSVIESSEWRSRVRLEWSPRGEDWPEVASASIVARAAWLEWQALKSVEEGRDVGGLTLAEMAAHPHRRVLFKENVLWSLREKQAKTGVFSIRPYSHDDQDRLRPALLTLRRYYPTIQEWVDGKDGKSGIFGRIESAKSLCWVATAGEELAGFAIVTPRSTRVAKLSTFYIFPRHRGRAIGSQLLNRVVNLTGERGLERLYVTLASEERRFFVAFFRKFGFLVDGIQPQRYRRNSFEVVMGRTSIPRVVSLERFGPFVRDHLFLLRGFDLTEVGDGRFLARSTLQMPALFGTPAPERYLVELYIHDEPRPGTARVLGEEAQKNSAHGLLVCFHGLKKKPVATNVTVLDAYDIETMFYPLRLDRHPDPAWVIPIEPEYADQLIPRWGQATLEAVKLQLSTENVYYRVADRIDMLRRGASLLWYVSTESRIRGESKLAGWAVGRPRDLSRRFGPKGAWAEGDIEAHVGKGNQALALEFDWYKEYKDAVPIDRLRELVPKFNPQTVYKITEAEARDIRRLGTRQEMQSYSP